jgi:hypothetical protein
MSGEWRNAFLFAGPLLSPHLHTKASINIHPTHPNKPTGILNNQKHWQSMWSIINEISIYSVFNWLSQTQYFVSTLIFTYDTLSISTFHHCVLQIETFGSQWRSVLSVTNLLIWQRMWRILFEDALNKLGLSWEMSDVKWYHNAISFCECTCNWMRTSIT